MSDVFGRLSRSIAQLSGSPIAFLIAVLIIIVWAVAGPVFGFSDTWQLVINTGTTIVTFLMVFLIQNTQNRDSTAVQLKLDELIHATGAARNEMIALEEDSEARLTREQERFRQVAAELNEASGDALEAARLVGGDTDAEERETGSTASVNDSGS
ncbi:MAG TPA: low affinity iron permease family protein [Dehalococcoidia bacterium]|nr:low affinity iron permease family protein [Dehalococcoidia bacterium]